MQETPVMQQYRKAKETYSDCLVFFRLGDFYELFYEDAITASSILNITLTRRVQKDQEIPMCGVPAHTSEHYLAKLIKSGKRVAICEQTEQAFEKDPKSKVLKREVVRIITPGTIVEEGLLEAKKNNFLLSIFGDGIEVGVAILDISTGSFSTELIEAIEIRNFIEKTDPSEILLPETWVRRLPDYEIWKEKIVLIPTFNVSIDSINKKLLKAYNLHSLDGIGNFSKEEKMAFSAIIDYIEKTQKNLTSLPIPIRNSNSYMLQMDQFTRRNLEITKTLQGKHEGSILWLLDETQTAAGARNLLKTLNNPITQNDILEQRYDCIEFFAKTPSLLSYLKKTLNQISDFERIISRISLNKASPRDLRSLGDGLLIFSKILNFMPENLPCLFKNMITDINPHQALADTILKAIIESAPITTKDTGYIKEGFDADLDFWRDFEEKTALLIEEIQEKYKQESKISTLKIKKHLNLGYIIEIPSSQKEKMSYNFNHKQDLMNVSRYTTGKLEEINAKLTQSADFIFNREKQIFIALCQEVLKAEKDIKKSAQFISNIDLYACFASFSIENNYVRPQLTLDKDFEIKQGRHAILDKLLKKKGEVFVANDCDLTKPIILMTGPNMAGKSTYLRQQALIVLLAHIGMFIPATYCKIGIVDRIFSRIGASDNLSQGNSTFMVEMIETALTINQASEKSFIIFDEVGRGTSTEEGFAIAQSILEYLTDKLGARCLFATHYLDLHKINSEFISKKTMQIIENPLCFTHKVIEGFASHSYAFAVANMAGMPAEIISRAEEIFKMKQRY